MTKSKVFCNTPWFEVKINADGTYQTCGAQPKHTSNSYMKNYNVFNLSVNDWINSEYQRNVRLHKLNGIPESLCSICYKEDEIGSSSKRIRDNLKSKINPNQFEKTFKQSPHFQIFEESKNSGFTNVKPISYHLSLGNECNLACKMCSPWSSSRIAVAAIKDGTHTGPARLNWTDNETAWQSVLSQICSTPNLEFVHIIGGEPMLTNRFEQLVDQLIAAKISNIYLGFTTNGTIWNESLIKKLKFFD